MVGVLMIDDTGKELYRRVGLAASTQYPFLTGYVAAQ